MRVAIAADRRVFPLKGPLILVLEQLSDQVLDLGTHSVEPVDYPDYACALGRTS